MNKPAKLLTLLEYALFTGFLAIAAAGALHGGLV